MVSISHKGILQAWRLRHCFNAVSKINTVHNPQRDSPGLEVETIIIYIGLERIISIPQRDSPGLEVETDINHLLPGSYLRSGPQRDSPGLEVETYFRTSGDIALLTPTKGFSRLGG